MALCWRPSKLVPDMRPKTTPLQGLPELVEAITRTDWRTWTQRWLEKDAEALAAHLWAPDTDSDWLWCLGLPILSQAEQSINNSHRILIGLSALPGCGKTTFGQWLEAAAKSLDLAIQVISIDDFYLPAAEMEQAMAGNPWGVPRALPGSHDIVLMAECLSRWKQGSSVTLPRFDKALRQGRGDRCGSCKCNADVLVVEGWFLGCSPLRDGETLEQGTEHLQSPLTMAELNCRRVIQTELESYQEIWQEIDSLWQLAATDFNSPTIWKRQQEQAMQLDRGAGPSQAAVSAFIRMIQTALPATSFELDQASVVIEIDPDRRFRQIRVNN